MEMGLTRIKLDEVYGKIDEAIKNQTKSILFDGQPGREIRLTFFV